MTDSSENSSDTVIDNREDSLTPVNHLSSDIIDLDKGSSELSEGQTSSSSVRCTYNKLNKDEISQMATTIQDYAAKYNISVRNVKSITKNILSDERLIMFAKQLADQTDNNNQLHSQILPSEQKMTRSVVRQLANQTNQIPMSPLTVVEDPKSLLDINFSDQNSSSDEEYNPDLETQFDGSNQSLPLVTNMEDRNATDNSSSLSSFSQSPTFTDNDTLHNYNEYNLRNKSLDMQCSTSNGDTYNNTNSTLSIQEVDRSYPTRSRGSLRDVSLNEIEATFLPPDITPEKDDETSHEAERTAWREWLASLCFMDGENTDQQYQQQHVIEENNVNAIGSDSDNDMDYNFLQDIDGEIDKTEKREEFRYDYRVRVSQKELYGLIDSLVEEVGPYGIVADDECNLMCGEHVGRDSSLPSSGYEITCGMLQNGVALSLQQQEQMQIYMQQLQYQLQQHLQLLFQNYILSLCNPDLKEINLVTAKLIMDFYDNIASPCSPSLPPLFKFPSLDEAMHLIYSPPILDYKKLPRSFKNNKLKMIPQSAIRIMQEYDIFWVFPEFLPHYQLVPVETKHKQEDEQIKGRKFLVSEDVLLAFGIDLFGIVGGVMKICQYILPNKTPKQILSRLKNLCSNRYETNVVKLWKQTKQLIIPWEEMQASLPKKIPQWAEQYISACKTKLQGPINKLRRIQKKSVKKTELSQSFVNKMLMEYNSIEKELSNKQRLALVTIIFDIDKYSHFDIENGENKSFYKKVAYGLWSIVRTTLMKFPEKYYELTSVIYNTKNPTPKLILESITPVLKDYPAILFLFAKYLQTSLTKKKNVKNEFFTRAKIFLERLRLMFKSNPRKVEEILKLIQKTTHQKQVNLDLFEQIREKLTKFEGASELFVECINDRYEIDPSIEIDFEEIYITGDSMIDNYDDEIEFEEIYLDPINQFEETNLNENGNQEKQFKEQENFEAIKKAHPELQHQKQKQNIKTQTIKTKTKTKALKRIKTSVQTRRSREKGKITKYNRSSKNTTQNN